LGRRPGSAEPSQDGGAAQAAMWPPALGSAGLTLGTGAIIRAPSLRARSRGGRLEPSGMPGALSEAAGSGHEVPSGAPQDAAEKD